MGWEERSGRRAGRANMMMKPHIQAQMQGTSGKLGPPQEFSGTFRHFCLFRGDGVFGTQPSSSHASGGVGGQGWDYSNVGGAIGCISVAVEVKRGVLALARGSFGILWCMGAENGTLDRHLAVVASNVCNNPPRALP